MKTKKKSWLTFLRSILKRTAFFLYFQVKKYVLLASWRVKFFLVLVVSVDEVATWYNLKEKSFRNWLMWHFDFTTYIFVRLYVCII